MDKKPDPIIFYDMFSQASRKNIKNTSNGGGRKWIRIFDHPTQAQDQLRMKENYSTNYLALNKNHTKLY